MSTIAHKPHELSADDIAHGNFMRELSTATLLQYLRHYDYNEQDDPEYEDGNGDYCHVLHENSYVEHRKIGTKAYFRITTYFTRTEPRCTIDAPPIVEIFAGIDDVYTTHAERVLVNAQGVRVNITDFLNEHWDKPAVFLHEDYCSELIKLVACS